MDIRKSAFFILPSLHGGGAERVTISLIRELQNSDNWKPVLVLTTDRKGRLDSSVPDGLRIIRLGAKNSRRSIPSLISLIRREKPEIVFSSLDHQNIMIGSIGWMFPSNTKTILRATNLNSLEKGWFRLMLRASLKAADMVIFQSDQMRERMTDELRIPGSVSSRVIPNPLKLQAVRELSKAIFACESGPWSVERSQDSTRLVAVGRLDYQKGFDLLIEAIHLTKNLNISLCILGEGPEELSLRQKIKDLELEGRVHLCGFQSNPYSWFSNADAFVLSSRSEGFPNVVLEALACKCPVIATPLPGLQDLDGCRLSAGITSHDLACAIEKFVMSPHVVESTDGLKKFDSCNVIERYEETFNYLFEN